MQNTALITGASKRIGKRICEKLAENKWNIIIHYNKSKAQAVKLKNKLNNFSIKSCCIKADLSKENEVKKLFNKANKEMGNINCLINNASTFELDSIIRDNEINCFCPPDKLPAISLDN